MEFDHIDLHLVRVLHMLVTEGSVSRAAVRLGSTQPVVSAQLKRLRALLEDPLLVRAGRGMAPTDTARALAEPAARLLAQAEALFDGPRQRLFDPARTSEVFRLAASDYLDPRFLPGLVARVKRSAPGCEVNVLPLSADVDYRHSLALGEVDLVIGNWLEPPGELHLGRLISDEVVCMVAADHPAARRGLSLERYLACEHVAPTPTHPGARGVIDEHLHRLGLQRRITVRSAHFGQIPMMVAGSLLVLTTGRLFCSHFEHTLPVRIIRCPVAFPPMAYYQLWHDRSHASAPMRWFRAQARDVAQGLSRAPSRVGGQPAPGASAPPSRRAAA